MKPKSKIKVWSTQKADRIFSLKVRERDGRCVRCGKTENLQCSHFWGRSRASVRYDFENCDTLCYACHYGNAKGWEYSKQGKYREFKIKQLGEDGYKRLEKRANLLVSLRDARIALMAQTYPLYKEIERSKI